MKKIKVNLTRDKITRSLGLVSDKVGRFSSIISKAGIMHKMEHDVKKLLKSLKIFRSGTPRMRFVIRNRWKPNCFVAFIVDPEDNVFGKRIQIVIKPGQNPNQEVLRLVLQEGSSVANFEEGKIGWGDKRLFVTDLKLLERDLRIALIRFKRKERVLV